MKQYLKKLKAKMPAAPSEDGEDDDMLSMDLKDGDAPDADAHDDSDDTDGHDDEGDTGLPEGSPEEEAAETEKEHTAELSDDALLAEVKRRGLLKKAVAVSPKSADEEAKTGY